MNNMAGSDRELIERALRNRLRAYAPYSGLAVGAALLAADSRMFDGCNMENAAYSPTLCAERSAFAQAVAAGCRDFQAIAIVGGPAELAEEVPGWFWPCGVCRQVIAEFCGPAFRIIVGRSRDDYQVRSLAELLPEAFGPAQT